MASVSRSERSEVARSLDLSIIRYSRVWEDHRVLSKALQVNENDDIISITRYVYSTKCGISLAWPDPIFAQGVYRLQYKPPLILQAINALNEYRVWPRETSVACNVL